MLCTGWYRYTHRHATTSTATQVTDPSTGNAAGAPCSKRASADGGSRNGGTPEPETENEASRLPMFSYHLRSRRKHKPKASPTYLIVKSNIYTLYLSSVDSQSCHSKHAARSTQHPAGAHTCMSYLCFVLWGIPAPYSLLSYSYVATGSTQRSYPNFIQSFACPSREIPTAISWSSQLLKRSEGNMAGDVVMAASRKNGSKHGVSAGK